MNWIPLDKENPPEGKVIFYVPQPHSTYYADYVVCLPWSLLNDRGRERATHYCEFTTPV